MSTQAINHLKKTDPVLAKVIEEIEEIPELVKSTADKFFYDLCDSIISQQLSVKAGNTILGRFNELFSNKNPTPEAVLKIPVEKLRLAGLSNAKARYIHDLAEKIVSTEIELDKIIELEDEEIIKELTKVKGIGRWTAEMFLIFSLAREDIFSHGDLGLKNAIKKIYQLENPTQEEIEKIVKKWSPFKSFASRVLWRSLNNQPKVLT